MVCRTAKDNCEFRMKYLWQDIDKITSLLENNRPKLLILDFDGTLAPIVETPRKAKLPKKTKDVLQKLAQKSGFHLAVISGRELSDIKSKIGITNIIYGGNHGLEGEILEKRFIHPAVKKAAPIIKNIFIKAGEIAQKYKGIFIENKKAAIGFHYRMAERNKIKEIKSLLEDLLKGFHDHKLISVIEGKEEIDILPKTDWGKGHFAELITKDISARTKLHPIVIAIGDDATDENAFKNLKNEITIVVGKKPASKAKYYLENLEDVFRFLKTLIKTSQSDYFPKENSPMVYFVKLRQIKKIVEEKDFENKEFLQFWKALVRDSSGRWINYYRKGIKYFKYGKQIKPDIRDNLQLAFIHSSIKHEGAFLADLYDQNFKNFKQWLIGLHKKQSYFGTVGQVLSNRRVSEGEHTQVVIESIPSLAKKYNDPYVNKGTQIVYLPEIDVKGCPVDRWKNGKVFHYYPDPKYHNQYLHLMKKKLVQFISRADKKTDKETIKIIANYYQYGINMHMFETVNQSLFGNQANAMLKLLGLKPIEHGIMDFAAMRLQPKSFARYFLNEVSRAQKD